MGFAGPYSGGNHQFMLKGSIRLIVPNPHRGDVSADLQIRLIRQAGVTRKQWENAK